MLTDPELDLPKELLEIMRDVHLIKSALYLDTTLASSRTVTRQLGSLNEVTEAMVKLYGRITGEEPPAPPKPMVESDKAPRSFIKGQVVESRPIYPGPARRQGPKPKPKPRPVGRPPKTKQQRLEDELDKLNCRPSPKRKKNKTNKVKGARKGHQPPPIN